MNFIMYIINFPVNVADLLFYWLCICYLLYLHLSNNNIMFYCQQRKAQTAQTSEKESSQSNS